MGRSFSHSCEQALMNTNVWIAQQLPLGGIIQLCGIIGAQCGETLGSGLPTVHSGMTELAECWPLARAFCQYSDRMSEYVWVRYTVLFLLLFYFRYLIRSQINIDRERFFLRQTCLQPKSRCDNKIFFLLFFSPHNLTFCLTFTMVHLAGAWHVITQCNLPPTAQRWH